MERTLGPKTEEGLSPSAAGERLPALTPDIHGASGERRTFNKPMRTLGLQSFTYSVAKSHDQNADTGQRKGEYNPALQLAIRWKNADQSTLLHETGHYFLDVSFKVASALLAEPNRTAEQNAFLDSVQNILDWFGLKDVNAWDALDFEKQRKYQEKFARSFEHFGYANPNELVDDLLANLDSQAFAER